MSESSSIIAAAIIAGLGGITLIWWWTRRPSLHSAIRALVRIVVIPAFLAVIVVAVLLFRQSAAATAQNAQSVVPMEQLTVQTGTLTVTLNSTGSLTPANEETLTFDASAPLTDVLVSPGDHVKAGDVLARIDPTALESQVNNAQIDLTDAQDALTTLLAPPTDLQIKTAKLQIEAAQASLSSASLSGPSTNDIQIAQLNVELAKNSLWQDQVNRDMAVGKPGYSTQPNAYANQVQQAAQLASSDANVAEAQANYQGTVDKGPDASGLASGNASLVSAQANLDSLLAGPSDSDVRKAQIAVDNAQLALDTATRNLDKAALIAPFDGLVASVDFVPGTMSASGSITLIDNHTYSIDLAVDEKDITQLKVGQTVSLQVQAFKNATVTGTVTRIDPAPVTSSSGQLVTYNVDVTLNPADVALRPGMSAIATVLLDQIDNVIVVPNRFITVDAATQKATVLVETAPGKYQTVPVTLGKRTDSDSEIVSGLNVGQTLVILPQASSANASQGGFFFPGAGRPPGGFGGGGFGRGGGGRPGGG